jgi:hypothetical protein
MFDGQSEWYVQVPRVPVHVPLTQVWPLVQEGLAPHLQVPVVISQVSPDGQSETQQHSRLPVWPQICWVLGQVPQIWRHC